MKFKLDRKRLPASLAIVSAAWILSYLRFNNYPRSPDWYVVPAVLSVLAAWICLIDHRA